MAADSLSYSGRLVKTNGAPVAGPVDLTIELSYTNAPSVILCSQSFLGVVLTNGVFHLKLDFNCGVNGSITEVLTAVPANESAAIRVNDVTNLKIYSWQAMHSMPFSSIAGTAKQLVQMGAADNQVLKWNNTLKKWEPGSPGGGGTVTSVSGTLPISVATGTTTPAISISQSNATTNGYLSSTDWNTFNSKQGTIAAGTTLQYYRGDKSWQTLDTSAVPENIANLYFTNARVLGVPLTDFVTATGAIVATDTTLQAFGKAQGQIDALTSGSSNYLVKNGSDTLSGTVSLTNVITATATGDIVVNSTPLTMTSAVNKAYVDTQRDSRVAKTGDTMSGALTLDNNLNLNPNGTAAGNTGEARFKELAANGANYVALKSPDALAANVIYTLPAADGVSGQALTTNAAGGLSWTSFATTGTTLVGDVGGTIDNNTIGAGKVTLTHMSATGTKNNTTYLRGDNTWAVLQTDVQALLLSAYAVGTNAVVTTTDSVVGAFGKLQKQITDLAASAVGGDLTGNLPNPTVAKLQGGTLTITTPTNKNVLKYDGAAWVNSMIAASDLSATGTVDATTYLAGDNTWKDFNSGVIAAPLTGLSSTGITKATGTLADTDSITAAFNKLLFTQGDYVSKSVDQTINGTLAINSLTGFITVPTPVSVNDAANKGYVDGFGQWIKGASSSINYTAGNVGIGTLAPSNNLSVTPLQYNTGTASQSSTTVTGVGTTWTSAMVGSQFVFADGVSAGTITAFGSATSLTVTASQTVASQSYSIGYTGLQVASLGNVGIGIDSPATSLHILSNQPSSAVHPNRAGFILESEGTSVGGRLALKVYSDTESPLFVGYHARGTKALPTALLSGDQIGGFAPVGYDGAGGWQSGAHIRYNTTENWSATNIGSAISFRTPANGTTSVLERMRIDQSGNVGIGTTTPTATLHVNKTAPAGTISSTGTAVSGAGTNFTTAFSVGDQIVASGQVKTITAITDATNLTVNSGFTADLAASTAYARVGTILNSGNVGIGTATPEAKLDVTGNIYINGNYGINQHNGSYTASSGIREIFRVSQANLSTSGFFTITATRNSFVHSSQWSWSSSHNSTGRGVLTQLSSGGYSNIVVYLDVAANGSVIVSADWGAAQTYSVSILKFAGNNVDLTANNTDWSTVAGSYTRLRTVNTINEGVQTLNGVFNGSVGIGTAAPGYKLDVQGGDINASGSVRAAGVALTSDRRWKRNILPLKNSIEKIKQINGVSYDWAIDDYPEKHFSNRKQIGVIAQDVEAVFPELILKDNQGFLSVNYPALIAPLIEAFKTQQQQIEANVRMFKTMQGEIEEIKLMVADNAREIALLRVRADKAEKENATKTAKLEAETKALKKENQLMRAKLEKIEKFLEKLK